MRTLQDMKMDLKTFIKDNVMPKEPFERPGSHKFINAVKEGDIEVVRKMLKRNNFYVYDFDSIHQTALHWAAKRNHKEIIELLLDHGANVNAFDIVRFHY